MPMHKKMMAASSPAHLDKGPATFLARRTEAKDIKKVTIPMMPKANKAYGIVRLR